MTVKYLSSFFAYHYCPDLCRPSWQLAAVVAVISVGLFLLVAGETQFHLVGFIMVMSASALAGLRWTITQVLLQGDKHTGECVFVLQPSL